MESSLIIFLVFVLMTAALCDLRLKRIPNLLTYPSMLMALGYHVLANGFEGFIFSLGGLFLGTAIFFVPYLMGGMGAGDAKLMGAVGAILGVKGVLLSALFSMVVGGVYAVVLLCLHQNYARQLMSRLLTLFKTWFLTRQFVPISAEKNEKKLTLRYGVAIAFGTFFYVLINHLDYQLVIGQFTI